MKLIAFFLSFAFFGLSYGFGEIYSLNQNGQTHSYLLAEDEAYVEAVNFRSSRLLLKRLKEHWPETMVVQEYDGAVLVQLPLYQRAQGVINAAMETKIGGVKLSPVLYLMNGKVGVRNEATRRLVTEKIVVEAGAQKEAKRLAKRFGKGLLVASQKQGKSWILKYKTAWDALVQAQAMQQKGLEAQVMMARVMARRLTLNDRLYFDLWHLKDQAPLASVPLDMNVESAWDSVSGKGIGLAIVDDGLDVRHRDLKSHIPKRREKLNVDFNKKKMAFNPKPRRSHIHGTACAGLAAGVGNNGRGIAGVAYNATLVGIRLIAKPFTDVEAAMAMKWRPDRISIYSSSWGPFDSGRDLVEASPGPLMQSAIEEGVMTGRSGLGSIYLWAGGNGRNEGDHANYDGYANSRYVIAVGAYDKRGEQSYYSESGANILAVAPSSGQDPETEGVFTTFSKKRREGNAYFPFTGTSAAAPQVAGVVALLLQKNPNLGWRDVKEILLRTANCEGLIATNAISWDASAGNEIFATNAAGFAFSHSYGAGRVDAGRAVALAAGWTNLGAEMNQFFTAPDLNMTFSETNDVVQVFEVSSNENIRVETALFSIHASGVVRSNLVVELTSPSGMKSVVPYRFQDGNIGLTNWTFSSVRHWGESSQGNWQLRAINLSPTPITIGESSTPTQTNIATVHSLSLQLFGTKL